MSAQAKSPRRKPRRRRLEKDLPLLDTRPFREWWRTTTVRLPEIGEKLKPILQAGRDKIGDAYSSLAQVLAAQKEALDDHFAERRQQGHPPSSPVKRTVKSARATRKKAQARKTK